VSVEEWRRISGAEQRAVIRDGITPIADLPDDIHRQVEQMVANARPLPS
jgi:hypothetical protein